MDTVIPREPSTRTGSHHHHLEAAGNNKITELGKQARQGQLYVFTYVQYYGTRLLSKRTILLFCVVYYLLYWIKGEPEREGVV